MGNKSGIKMISISSLLNVLFFSKRNKSKKPIRRKDVGVTLYFIKQKLHREDGPAFISASGIILWYQNDKLHREDGPAAIYPSGTMEWYQNGKLHREDGPAVVYPGGFRIWFLNGKEIKNNEND